MTRMQIQKARCEVENRRRRGVAQAKKGKEGKGRDGPLALLMRGLKVL